MSLVYLGLINGRVGLKRRGIIMENTEYYCVILPLFMFFFGVLVGGLFIEFSRHDIDDR